MDFPLLYCIELFIIIYEPFCQIQFIQSINFTDVAFHDQHLVLQYLVSLYIHSLCQPSVTSCPSFHVQSLMLFSSSYIQILIAYSMIVIHTHLEP